MKPGRIGLAALLAIVAAQACGGRPDDGGARATPVASSSPAGSSSSAALPGLGSQLSDFPEGPGQATARASCLQCHSADLPRQQRLTEKQWTAVVDKMVRWGTSLSDDQRTELIAYFARHFGPDNAGFTPIVTLPVQSP